MKPIAVILVVLVLFLSAIPCGAMPGGESNQKEQCDDNDGNCQCCCSPFFCCGTCAGFALDLTSAPQLTGAICVEVITEPIAVCDAQIHSSFHCNIWQPPQLA